MHVQHKICPLLSQLKRSNVTPLFIGGRLEDTKREYSCSLYASLPRIEHQWRKWPSFEYEFRWQADKILKVLVDWSKSISIIVKINENVALLFYNHCTMEVNSTRMSTLWEEYVIQISSFVLFITSVTFLYANNSMISTTKQTH